MIIIIITNTIAINNWLFWSKTACLYGFVKPLFKRTDLSFADACSQPTYLHRKLEKLLLNLKLKSLLFSLISEMYFLFYVKWGGGQVFHGGLADR